MAIAFFDFVAGTTAIVQHDDRVTGWQVDVERDGERMEMLYARHTDGRVMECGPIAKPNHAFNVAGRAWALVLAVPMDAEFIGHYQDDMFQPINPTADRDYNWRVG